MGCVALPCTALHVVVALEKATDVFLAASEHVGVGIARAKVAGVVLSGRCQRCEGRGNSLRERREGFVPGIGAVPRVGPWWVFHPSKGGAHEDDGAKNLWVSGDAVASNEGSEIVADEHGNGAMSEGFDKRINVLCDVERVEGSDWVVVLNLLIAAVLRDSASIPS